MPFDENTLPPHLESEDDAVRFRAIRRFLDRILKGRVNWTGELTVSSGTTTTRVYNDNVRTSSAVSLTPMDTNGAALIAAGIWVAAQVESSDLSGVNVGYFDLNHADPPADCTFRYAIIG